jgi:ribosomal-protein-alanine N-acetyltransferase
MTHKGTITLETERLILRRFTKNDTDAMFRNWASDPEVTKYTFYSACNTLEETQKCIAEWMSYLDKSESGAYAIVLRKTGEVIGTIDYRVTNNEAKSAEVGYQIGKAWWGNGYTAEALRALMKHCFENIGLNRICADYDPRNPNSGRVVQKAGFVYEGTSRQCKIRGGKWVDRVHYAILAEDYFAKTQINNPHLIIVHGAPGCGKTTIAKKLHERYKCPWFEFGWIPLSYTRF